MLLRNRLNSVLALLTLLGAVACAEDEPTTEDPSTQDAGDDTAGDDDIGADDDADDDAGADDDADDDVGADDDADDDAGTDDDIADDDAADDDAGADDDVVGDDDVDAGDDDIDAGAPDAGADDDVVGDDDVDAGDDDVDAGEGADDDVPATVDAGGDAGLPDNGGACTVETDCIEGSTCFEGVCVQAGSGLRLSVTWDSLADLDIHVLTPSGFEVFYGAPVGGGGFLDVDDCAYNEGQYLCIDPEGTHVESIFFETPEAGDYTVAVHGFQTEGAVIDFTVQAFADDVELETLTGSVGNDEFAQATLSYTP
jgi:hypothetical protein